MTTFKSLREIVTFKGGGTPSKQIPEYWNGGIPWASVKDFTSTSLSDTQDFISQEGLKNSSANLIPKGHVIIPTRMSLGKAAINSVDLAINQDLRALVPKVPLDTQFLLHAVLSLKDEIVKKGSGATVKGITQDELYKLEIAFPPLNDQKRIAHLLCKVEGLISRRKQHLQQLDDLLKSVFLEMFGDPVRNEKGWEKKPFSELLINVDSGKSPKCEAREAEKDEWGVLKLGAVTSCIFKEGKNKALPQDIEPNAKDEVKPGDLLFGRKNTYDLVAACAYVFETRPRLLLPDLIFRFVLKEDVGVNPIFLWKLLISNSQRKKIQALATGAAGSMPNISKANLKQVLLPLPPIDLQNQFADIVEKVETVKSRYQHSLVDLESLYGALSQKAFKGELDLSRVLLPVELKEEEVDHQRHEKYEEKATPAEGDILGQIEFSALDEYPMSTKEGRERLLRGFFDTFLHELNDGDALSLDTFWKEVNFKSVDYMDEEGKYFDQAEYDLVKAWVFEALEQGHLAQGYDDANNRVQITAAKG